MSLMSLFFFVACVLSHANAFRRHASVMDVGSSSFEAKAGDTLGSYELVEHLYSYPVGSSLLDASDADDWPEEIQGIQVRYSSNATLLGSGSFGEVWKAVDKVSGQEVAIKFFKQGGHYLHYEGLIGSPNRKSLDSAYLECNVVHAMLEQAHKDPVGASHIAGCLSNHIRSTNTMDLAARQVSYLVLEPAGKELTDLIAANRQLLRGPVAQAREVVVQILQALAFLQSFDPPIIHHDLKPANVVYEQDSSGRIFLKLIDFGALMTGEDKNRRKSDAAATQNYAPPENAGRNVMSKPWWSYDIWAVGIIYLEMLCTGWDIGALYKYLNPGGKKKTAREWQQERQDRLGTLMYRQESGKKVCPAMEAEDVELIIAMLQTHDLRPSPSELLANPTLQPYARTDTRADLPAIPRSKSLTETIQEMMDVTQAMDYKGRMEVEGKKLKCCCNPSSGQCQLVNLNSQPQKCSKRWLFLAGRERCGCLVGEGWKSFRTTILNQCVITSEENARTARVPGTENIAKSPP